MKKRTNEEKRNTYGVRRQPFYVRKKSLFMRAIGVLTGAAVGLTCMALPVFAALHQEDINNTSKEDANVNQISHFADITLNQNVVDLTDDTIIVDNKCKPTLVPQLEKIGILAAKIKMFIIDNVFYPIYKIDFSKVNSQRYYETELLAA